MSLSKVSVPGLSVDVDITFVTGFNELQQLPFILFPNHFPVFFFVVVFFSSMFVVPPPHGSLCSKAFSN